MSAAITKSDSSWPQETLVRDAPLGITKRRGSAQLAVSHGFLRRVLINLVVALIRRVLLGGRSSFAGRSALVLVLVVLVVLVVLGLVLGLLGLESLGQFKFVLVQ